MKIYERPSIDIKTFDVEDALMASGVGEMDNKDFGYIVGDTSYTAKGVVFEW